MKNNGGSTILILTFLLAIVVGAFAAFGAPPLLVVGGVALCGILAVWGFLNFFADYFDYLNKEAEWRHKELMKAQEQQHREFMDALKRPRTAEREQVPRK